MYGTSQYGLVNYCVDTITADEINKYKVDLTKYVPTFISDISEMKAIYDVQGTELGSLLYYLDDIIKQFFIDTVTWGLIYWEDEYGIETNLDMSYEDRRTILKAKKRGQGTTTKEMIKNVAESFSGVEVSIVEDNVNYSFKVKFIGIKGIPKNMEAFKNILEDIRPAHLGYVFEYTYTVWNVLKEKNLIWTNSIIKTWDELKIYE
jgi:hypothetical protein